MNEPHPDSLDRRVFLQAGMVATAATTGLVARNTQPRPSRRPARSSSSASRRTTR